MTQLSRKTDRRDFLRMMGGTVMGLGAGSAFAALLAGCESMGQVAAIGSTIASSAGLISQDQQESIVRSANAVGRTFKDITPEQEYYIGRTVGAMILDKYRPYTDKRVSRYVNVMGQTLAMASDMPETYGGYRFQVLDTDDINALSAPGGLIFVTRGLLRCCPHEDAAAAVLAHEIGHVQLQHGLQAIKSSRVTSALTTLGMEGLKSFSGQQVADLTRLFEGTVSDIVGTMVEKGYSRSQEYEADAVAATIMNRVGYQTAGLSEMLAEMKKRLVPGRADFASTHPSPADRIKKIQGRIPKDASVKAYAARTKRFKAALGRI